ncbi:HAD family hydrolase [Butyrivibrio sp. MB2005]|uniref:HAD family hydrolase n=1 Tax=Butyrivibrio sp. MB2005 TaxID=1280678 RepID=UPI00041CC274|nr:HAD-IA family hydrolase [Butyrivibrio sp. MB2005]
MIKAVIFDMFETLVTLFEGKTYFGENIAADVGVDPDLFRKEWHAIEKERSIGVYTIEQGLEVVFKKLGVYSEENVSLAVNKRRENLEDTFNGVPDDSIRLLQELKKRGIKVGFITNTFSDERDFIRDSTLFQYFDVALISYEQGICKPDPELFQKMTKLLDVEADECLYVGDGGSKELFAARDAGMHPVQCTWFHDRAFEPHIPCPILDEFDHANHQLEVLDYC